MEDIKRGVIIRDEKGYPLLPDGSIDWGLTSIEKELIEQHQVVSFSGKKKFRKVDKRFTKPKKKRK